MSVASKNLFAYLGNDDDGEEKPVVPVKTVDKTSTRTSKRTEGPAAPTRGNANRRGPSGSEGAFRDRGVGSDRNRARGTDEQPANRGPRGGSGARVRGGRGSGRPRDRDDRQSRNAPPG
jgi:plasminogen activator inhibitor 1 RNA-binding protein